MLPLLRLLFAICLLRQTPQDIPYSQVLLKLLVLGYAVIAFLLLLPTENIAKTLLEVSVEIGVTFIFVWGMLAISQKQARFTQALCAFLGTDAMISFFALPAFIALSSGQQAGGAGLVLVGLMTWHWVVCGHIIRHALSQTFSFGLGIALLYNIGFYQLMDWLFPVG